MQLTPNAVASADQPAPPAPAEFLARLTLEAIRLRPSCLVQEAQAEQFARDCTVLYPNTADGRAWLPVLWTLLDMGVAAADKERLAPLLCADAPLDTLAPDVFEPILNQLRAPQVELHIHRSYFSALVPADAAALLNVVRKDTPAAHSPSASSDAEAPAARQSPAVQSPANTVDGPASSAPIDSSKQQEEVKAPADDSEADLLDMLRDGLFYVGLVVPPIDFVLQERIPPGLFVIRINDRLALPLVGLAPDELLVNETPHRLRQLGIEAKRAARNHGAVQGHL